MTEERKRERRLTHKRRTRRRREPAGPGAVGGPTQWGAKAQPHCVFLPYISPSHSLHSLYSVLEFFPSLVYRQPASARVGTSLKLPRYSVRSSTDSCLVIFVFLFWHHRLASQSVGVDYKSCDFVLQSEDNGLNNIFHWIIINSKQFGVFLARENNNNNKKKQEEKVFHLFIRFDQVFCCLV